MKDLKRIPSYRVLLSDWQLWLNLMGKWKGESPVELNGDAISVDDLKRFVEEDKFVASNAKRAEAFLCTFFGEHEKLAKIVLLDKGKRDHENIGSPNLVFYALCRGVSSFAAYRTTKNRGYRKMGLAWRAKLKKWRNDGCPNVLHHCSFIDAEFEATKGNISAAIKHFETAVLMSARGGLLLDAALVSERFGELYLENGDNENAPFRFGQAIQYYKDSDAYGKVDDMEGKYAELMPKPKEIVLS